MNTRCLFSEHKFEVASILFAPDQVGAVSDFHGSLFNHVHYHGLPWLEEDDYWLVE